MDTGTTGAGFDIAEARDLLLQARRYNEAEAAASRLTLTELIEDGSASAGSMGNVVAAARFSLADTESILTEVAAAEARIEAGSYGTCEGCGQHIGVERLRIRPYVRTCIECAGGAKRP